MNEKKAYFIAIALGVISIISAVAGDYQNFVSKSHFLSELLCIVIAISTGIMAIKRQQKTLGWIGLTLAALPILLVVLLLLFFALGGTR